MNNPVINPGINGKKRRVGVSPWADSAMKENIAAAKARIVAKDKFAISVGVKRILPCAIRK
jgi:hypothetical protein